MRRTAKHVRRQLTPVEKARVAAARKQLEAGERDEILTKARIYKREADGMDREGREKSNGGK